jgi:hypothetical protein
LEYDLLHIKPADVWRFSGQTNEINDNMEWGLPKCGMDVD